MNFIKQLIFYTYCIHNEEVPVCIEAIYNYSNEPARWNLIHYYNKSISKNKINVATIYTYMNCHINNINTKEIIIITQRNHDNNQYELKIALKEHSYYYYNNTNWNVTYHFIKP